MGRIAVRSGSENGRRRRRAAIGAGLALAFVAGFAQASLPLPEARLAPVSGQAPILEAAARGKGSKRGSSAELQGGSSADRYGGSSADRQGVAGEHDRRVYGKPKRPPKAEEPKKPKPDEQQDEEEKEQ